jgi:hypothetical protein
MVIVISNAYNFFPHLSVCSRRSLCLSLCNIVAQQESKKNTVETSTFGSEFVAMKITVELIDALRYKLRMFGIPIEGPASVFCDNNSVVLNVTVPESTLSKKHNAIAYHRVRESVASRVIRVAKEQTETNLADPLTKQVPREQRSFLFERWMY